MEFNYNYKAVLALENSCDSEHHEHHFIHFLYITKLKNMKTNKGSGYFVQSSKQKYVTKISEFLIIFCGHSSLTINI